MPSPMLPSASRFSQTPLELCTVLSDSARAFSHVPENTCTERMSVQDVKKFHNSDSHILELWRPLPRSPADLVSYSDPSGSYSAITRRHFIDHIGLLQSQALLNHNIASIMSVSLYIYIRRYRDNGHGHSDRQYILGIPWGR